MNRKIVKKNNKRNFNMAIILKMCVAVFLTLFVSKLCVSVASMAMNVSPVSSRNEIDCSAESFACGWAVYKPLTKQLKYFIKSKCECGANQKCIRSWDDIQKTAYVYECKIPNGPNK